MFIDHTLLHQKPHLERFVTAETTEDHAKSLITALESRQQTASSAMFHSSYEKQQRAEVE